MLQRNRIFLSLILLMVLAVGVALHHVADDLDMRYRESTEETLVDIAYIMAEWIRLDAEGPLLSPQKNAQLHQVFDAAYAKRFEAKIYNVVKQQVNMHTYVTDAKGIVIFDSANKAEGQDFSRWHDVNAALHGQYGVRTTRTNRNADATAIMYVAASIQSEHGLLGVVSVSKPVSSLSSFVSNARKKLLYVGLITSLAFILLIILVTIWLTRPQSLWQDIKRTISKHYRQPFYMLQRLRILLRIAFRDVRDTLAGKQYTEEYVQALTHEIKSPLTAIRGAAELIKEPLPEAQRERFCNNINEQVARLQDLAERLLALANLEKKRQLDQVAPVALIPLIESVFDDLSVSAAQHQVNLTHSLSASYSIEGDAFLLHHAISNLVANAIDFSPTHGIVTISAELTQQALLLNIRDQGAGVPDYALEQAFERFYSTRRPQTSAAAGKKGTGLGLAFVREIALLHGGNAELNNHPQGGAVASLRFPKAIILT